MMGTVERCKSGRFRA